MVDGGEVAEVFHEDAALHHVGQREAGGGENGGQVLQHLVGLGRDVAGHELAGSIKGNLPGHVHGVARLHGLRVGTNGGRSLVGENNLVGHICGVG